MQYTQPKTKEEARDFAIKWQAWASEQDLSYAHLCYWQGIIMTLAEQFDLLEEFKENGIL